MTMASTVAALRQMLDDRPEHDTITEAVSDTTTTTITVEDVTKWGVGNVWEFDDGGASGAETVYVKSINSSTSVVTTRRGWLGSTAATHADNCIVLKDPKYRYNQCVQAINTILEADLFQEGIYEIVEHQVTSNTVAQGDDYNSPAAACEKFLSVYQLTSTMTEPDSDRIWYSPYPVNADTSLYANGKMFTIKGNYGVPGTDIYYINCAHKLQITTLSAAQQRIVELLAAAYLLEHSDNRRLSGPTNQGDQTVRPGQAIQQAAYFRGLAEELLAKEKKYLNSNYPNPRRFVRHG